MESTYGVFMLGIAVGIFLGWLYDIVRARKILNKERPAIAVLDESIPKLFLTINGVVQHEVRKGELDDLILELGRVVHPQAAEAFKNGSAVRVGEKVVQLISH